MNERDLFLSALEIEDPAARQAHLQAACGANGELLSRVESLLASHQGESQFLQIPVGEQLGEEPVGEIDATLVMGTGSTHDDEPDGSENAESLLEFKRNQERVHMSDEVTLGYLEPTKRSDSLGRLGHYEILEVIGRGAFGTVLRAFDEKLQRVVAIKVMAPELAATSPARKRFLREAQSSAAIRHEHVVSVYAVEEKPIPFLVMEYIPGQTLQQKLDERGPLDVSTCLRLGVQIAEGLAAAHALNLIHRDIKPGNILLESGMRDRIKITDFGLARAADDASLTQSGVIAGTPMYMAPEQALGHKLDQRADLFSFGSVLYQMVSGRPPFRASSTLAVLKRLTEDTARPIKEIIPETPSWFCDIISKLHAKNPVERFQSAREVADVLANCEAQLKQNSRLQDFSRIPTPKAKLPRGTWWRWLAAAVLLLVVTEITGVTHLLRDLTRISPLNDPLTEVTPNLVAQQDVPDAEGWVQLFNSKDLTGWKTTPEAPGHWEVKDGILIGSQRRSNLYSERGDYANFHLRIEAKINLGGDSGVFFRSGWGTSSAGAYEAEIHKNRTYARKTGTITTPQANGPPLVLGLTTDDSLIQPDEWFTFEIIADQDRFITKVNGAETANCRDPANPSLRGHIGLQVWNPNTLVQFRKIEIKELPASKSSQSSRRQFASDEWIDVIPLIDPQLDKWDMRLTGKNEWRIEKGELIAGDADDKPCKLLLPLDADWRSFECEIEFTRRAGAGGFGFNIPTTVGDCPTVFNPPYGIYLGRRGGGVVLEEKTQLTTGDRTTLRVKVLPDQKQDHISVQVNDAPASTWRGDRTKIAQVSNESYPFARRLSLWLPGGSEWVFHKIRVRALGGGTVETLRPVVSATNAPPVAIAPFDAATAKAHQKAWAKYLGVDAEITISIGMKLRLIPPGEFTMGSSPEEIARAAEALPASKYLFEAEGPARRVRIDEPCYVGIHEVTVGQFRQFVKETGHQTAPEKDGVGSWGYKVDKMVQSQEFTWLNPAFTNSENLPVVCIESADAEAFCDWLSRVDGRRYEIPHESIWEFACRAGTTGLWYWGDQPEEGKHLDHGINPVGGMSANAFGLFDMLGNVKEFARADKTPFGFRGGGGDVNAWLARSALRDMVNIRSFKSSFSTGFRVAVVGDLKAKPPLTRQ